MSHSDNDDESGSIPPLQIERTLESYLGDGLYPTMESVQRHREKIGRGDESLRIWAYESPKLNEGRRKFFVQSPQKLVKWYFEFEYPHNFYEVIESNLPCRPYFDLDFPSSSANNERYADRVIDDFLDTVCTVLRKRLALRISLDNCLVLTSSREDKNSYHIFVHLPNGRLLENSRAMRQIAEEVNKTMPQSCFFHKSGMKTKKSIIDMSVYGKSLGSSKSLRLYYSRKKGSNVRFLQCDKYTNFYEDPKKVSHEQLLFDSLVVPSDYYDRDTIAL